MKTIAIVALFLGFQCLGWANIKPNQTLKIRILGVPSGEQSRLNAEYQVSASGYINMWQIGAIKASGKTKTRLAADIAAKYRASGIYTAPSFQITSQTDQTLVQKTITLGGQVKKAGPIAYRDGLTLFEALQAGGGETAFGAINRVKLHRQGKVREYNLKDDRFKTIAVYPGDLIEVPEKKWNGQ